MIYKFDKGEIVKLQNAGSIPEYNDIEQIAKYNREHGTNFWKMSQILEHDKQQAQRKTQDEKNSFWKILAGHPESAGEAILNKTIETANNTELPETRKKIYSDTAKSELGTTVGSLLTIPMLGEFSTYGLLGGTSRLAGGFGGSAVGSYTLGKAGELGDRTFGTTWMKPAGQIIGGFAGWPTGSNIAWRGAAKVAPNRVIGDFISGSLNKNVSSTTLGISDLQRNIEAGKIGWAPATTETLYHHADKHLTELDPMFKSWDVVNRDAPLGKVWLTKDNGKRIRLYRAQKKDAVFDPKSAENGVEQEQFAGKWFTPDTEKPKRYALNASKRNTPTELQYVDIPEDQLSMFEAKRVVPSYFDYEPEDFIIPFTYKRGTVPISDRTISIFGNDYENALKIAKSANPIDFTASRPLHYQTILKLNKPMVQLNEAVGTGKNATRNQVVRFAQDSGADGIQFKNILDNGLSHQNQTAAFKPITLGEITPTRPTFIPQKPVSTVHFDPRVKPLSRPISEAEIVGIPKSMRSNPKSLEDPYYWGYQQWNQKYFDALNRGDYPEVQRIRDLHFKVKAPNTKVVDENGMPLHMYHGTDKYFTIFKDVNPTNIKLITRGYHTKDYNLAKDVYARGWRKNSITGKSFIKTDANVYDDYLNITDPFVDTPNNNIQNLVLDLTGEVGSNWGYLHGKGRSLLRAEGHDGVYVPRYHDTYLPTKSAAQIKSADPITYNGFGEIIPIVKRDNFHNLDMRYKSGGILKTQK